MNIGVALIGPKVANPLALQRVASMYSGAQSVTSIGIRKADTLLPHVTIIHPMCRVHIVDAVSVLLPHLCLTYTIKVDLLTMMNVYNRVIFG
jgi:hypothetical protein